MRIHRRDAVLRCMRPTGLGVFAPMFGHVMLDPAAFQPFALVIACVFAVTVLAVSDRVHERFGF